MEILLDLDDKLYANRLAYRFSYLCSALVTTIGSYQENSFDICITDKHNNFFDERFIFLSASNNADCSIFDSSTKILNLVFEKYKKNTGISFLNYDIKDEKVFSFYSFEGGSGSSSVSITFARNLNNLKKKVLYITNTNLYFDSDTNKSNKILNFEYEIYKNHLIDLGSYIERDIYGLNILVLNNFLLIPDVIKNIKEKKIFDSYVIDYGVNKFSRIDSVGFCIVSDDDVRTSLARPIENCKYLINKASMNKNGEFYIPFDLNSFNSCEKYIDVSLNGFFSKKIISIIKSNRYDK